MFCRHLFGNISGGFRGISRDFAEIPEALFHFGVYDYEEVKSFFRIKGLQKRAFWGQKVFS